MVYTIQRGKIVQQGVEHSRNLSKLTIQNIELYSPDSLIYIVPFSLFVRGSKVNVWFFIYFNERPKMVCRY